MLSHGSVCLGGWDSSGWLSVAMVSGSAHTQIHANILMCTWGLTCLPGFLCFVSTLAGALFFDPFASAGKKAQHGFYLSEQFILILAILRAKLSTFLGRVSAWGTGGQAIGLGQ